MDNWENEDFEVTMPAKAPNKWEGEDEDDDVKDSWDAEEEEKKDDDGPKTTTASKKSKKGLEKKIEEKERKRKEEMERKLNEKMADMTPEEMIAEKLRRQKLQEESDLQLAKQLLGIDVPSVGLDSQEDFDKFKDDIINKIGESTKKEYFPTFVELLLQALCVHLSAADLKKLSTWTTNLHLEKLKIEKGVKAKKNKGKGAKLKVEGDTAYNEFSAYTEDYDDFM